MSADYASLLKKELQPAPFIHDPLAETSANAHRPLTNGHKEFREPRRARRGSSASLDDILGSVDGMDDEEDDWVIDDDGAGYSEGLNRFGKRDNGHLDGIDAVLGKRRATHGSWQPRLHRSFQPGSTPWRGNRKYLCKVTLECGSL